MQRPDRSSTLRRSHAAALTALICSALFLACIPAATARSDRERPSSEATEPAQSGESPSSSDQTPRGQRKDKSEGSGESSSEAPPAKPERHSRHTAATGTTSEGGEASSETTATTTPGGRHSGAGQRRQDTTGGAQGTSGHGGRRAAREGASAGGRAGGSANKAAATKGKTGEAGSSGETRRKHELAGDPHGSSHVAKGKAKKVEAAHPSSVTSESTGAGSSSSGSSTSSTPAETPAQTPSSASTPAAVASTASASLATSLAPSIARRAPHAPLVKSHRHTRAAGKQAPTSSSSASSPSSTSAAAPVALVAAVHPTRPKLARKHAAPVSSPLLGKTITRIVDVVPTPIRLLIVALVALALAMAGRSRLAARRARRAEQQRSELLEDVGLLQAALLPETPARLGPVGTSSAYRPAAGPAAGGDFYDVFALEDGKLAVIVGDVSGHGRKALPHTALLRFTLRAYLEAGLSPRGAVQTAGAVLDRQLGSSFATVVAATYNPRERRLVYASAGHPPPIVLGGGVDSQPLEPVTACSSPPVGIGMPTGTRQTILSIPGEAQVCFFTDGVTEARLGAGELYGSERLAGALKALGSNATADELLDCVSHMTASRPDDMAACMLHVEGEEASPKVMIEELELTREQLSSDRTEQFLLACGIPAAEAAQIMQRARNAVEQSGSVVLEVSRGEGAPEVSLQQDNLAYLQTRHAARQADLRVSV